MKNNSLFHVLNSTCCPFPQDHMAKLLELETKNEDIGFLHLVHCWLIRDSWKLPSGTRHL